MKLILLQGHERSITWIKYNHEGNLLFTTAMNPIVNVWCSLNAQLTTVVISGTVKWKQLALLEIIQLDMWLGLWGNIIMFSMDKQMGYQHFVSFFDLQDPSQIDNNEPYMKISCNDSKITSAVCGPLEECIILGHESGELNQYSAKPGEVLVNVKEHSWQINDIQLSRDMTMFVTASKNNIAKLFDSTTLEHSGQNVPSTQLPSLSTTTVW
ncbi:Eukaryotic translation initiation factor 3 subunit I [Pteropus alecto]|uniref:Serine-threonine kinase receptor-associated protein n=1 Tax=Pteropus alecto TaxID=9402 RepID=L5JYK0_PTEAL|nr:Eukaryotic translation initiation factor 3 subunit I [Pteropus alecto]